MKKLFLASLVLCMLTGAINAAKKIDTSFYASGKKHLLFYSIPDNYDSLKKYPLVVGLHYCGGTANSYRNSLTPLVDSLNVIVVCPDNSTNEISDAEIDIVTAAADSARSAYNIDSDSMYLTGMSCNGKFAFRQGLKKFYPFRGIFPWVPWIDNNNFSSFNLDSDIPVTLAVGTWDDNYSVLMNLYDSLKKHGANVNLVLVPEVRHVEIFPAFGNTMIQCLRYINTDTTISVQEISTVTMNNTDLKKEVEVKITTTGTKELDIKVTVGYNTCLSKSSYVYDKATGIAKISFVPKAGDYGTAKVVVEAGEVGGSSIAQSVFDVKVNKVTAINNTGSIFKTTLSPNPAKGYLNLCSTQPVFEYEIIDLTGKVVLKQTASGMNNTIDISGLSSGIYFLKSTNGNTTNTDKFCIN